MATESGRSDAPLIDALAATPERFELIQAVRLLERAAALAARVQGDEDGAYARQSPRVGGDTEPRAEAVRLRAALDLTFPATELTAYETGEVAEGGAEGRPALTVAAMGLNGPSGVLPVYYSEMVLEAQRGRNLAMRDFLDMFNHRAVSLFVRAADKYRIAMGFERSGGAASDPISGALYALIGLGEPSLKGRLPASDATLAYYAGHYAHHPRTAGALGQILSDYFERTARILQFRESWGTLPPHEQTQLGGGYAQLGVDAVCGSRVLDVQSAFRISLGPLTYEQFMAFLPGTPQMAELNALTRAYVGPALIFDIQLVLAAEEVPPLAFSSDPAKGGRLGWNTWLPTTGPRADADEAVFEGEAA
jgi:type VI secretion system protein ImpH